MNTTIRYSADETTCALETCTKIRNQHDQQRYYDGSVRAQAEEVDWEEDGLMILGTEQGSTSANRRTSMKQMLM